MPMSRRPIIGIRPQPSLRFPDMTRQRLLGIGVALLTAGWPATPRLIAQRAPATVSRPVFPDSVWARVSTPKSVGFSRAKLDSAAAYLATLGTTGAVVVGGGRILPEYGNTSELSYL